MVGETASLNQPAEQATSEVDEFAAILKQSFKTRTERAATEVDNAIGTLVKQALADADVIKDDVLDTINEIIARLDEKLSAQINEIMHAKEFQSIESAWRGLNYLTSNSETDSTLKIKVMNVGRRQRRPRHLASAGRAGARHDARPRRGAGRHARHRGVSGREGALQPGHHASVAGTRLDGQHLSGAAQGIASGG